ncbi:MAG: thiamine diphosphokinase [Firmicutes bacterium]|nr:thiamine diphosphokinase [Bacillota bacterium]
MNEKADSKNFSSTRAVVFSNGYYACLAGIKQRLRPHDWLICADGALAKLVALDLWPDLLVGDFDSVDQSLLQQAQQRGVELRTFDREKDYTDTELACREAVERGCRELLLVGAWGSRLDHSLANLLLLPPYVEQGLTVSLTDGQTDAYLVRDELVLRQCQDRLVSILSFTPVARGVTAQGFYWPLQEATLHWGQGLGISNIPIADAVTISVTEGLLLVIVTLED